MSEYGIGGLRDVPESTPQDDMDAARIVRRQAGPVDYPQGRKLACGHIVYRKAEVMSASLGSSCPDCYDRMSDG
jgi:hypothetical protein